VREPRLDIAPMQLGDLDEVLEIERHAFRSPWSRQLLLEELDREWAHVDVLRSRADGGQVAAYLNYWLVRDEVHLLNIAVHPRVRRRGYGRALMDHLLEFARRHRCRYLTLEVRRSNLAAIELYRAVGFEAVGVRPRYYVDDQEDAVVMVLELAEPAAPPDGG
jgi:[ribosomal protein S18]-alanine N-acetyltransferase